MMSLPHSQWRGSFQVRSSRLCCCESLQSVLSFTQASWLVDLHHLEDDLSSPKLTICNHLGSQSFWDSLHQQRRHPLLQSRKPLRQFLNRGRLHIEPSDGVTSQPLLITLSGHGHQSIPPPHCTVTDISNLWTDLRHPVTCFKALILPPNSGSFGRVMVTGLSSSSRGRSSWTPPPKELLGSPIPLPWCWPSPWLRFPKSPPCCPSWFPAMEGPCWWR